MLQAHVIIKTTSCDKTNLMNYRCALFLEFESGGLVASVFWAVLLSNRHENGTKVGHSCNAFFLTITNYLELPLSHMIVFGVRFRLAYLCIDICMLAKSKVLKCSAD